MPSPIVVFLNNKNHPFQSLDARPPISTKDDLVLTSNLNCQPRQKEAKMVANRYSCGDFYQLLSQQQKQTSPSMGHFHSYSDCGEFD